jgi:DNA polymerase III sliding clamp (beta) subunit (PCNA family)
MKIKTLKSIKAVLRESGKTLPILSYFNIEKDYLYYTNLHIYIKVKHSFPIAPESKPIVIRADHFLQTMDKIKAPFFIEGNDSQKITIIQKDSDISVTGEHSADFPQVPKEEDVQNLFTISPYEISILDIASQFIADDHLRPTMECVYLDEYFVVASDAHVLYYKKINKIGDVPVLFERDVIKLMMLFPALSFNIRKVKGYLCAENEAITIWWRSDMNMHIGLNMENIKPGYPNWRSALPTVEHTVIIPVKETISALDTIKFSVNQASGQVRCRVSKDTMTIRARDLDFGMSASEKVNIINSEGNEIEFGMKTTFLRKILKSLQDEGYYQVEMGYISENRAFLFANQILCMPMMLND